MIYIYFITLFFPFVSFSYHSFVCLSFSHFSQNCEKRNCFFTRISFHLLFLYKYNCFYFFFRWRCEKSRSDEVSVSLVPLFWWCDVSMYEKKKARKRQRLASFGVCVWVCLSHQTNHIGAHRVWCKRLMASKRITPKQTLSCLYNTVLLVVFGCLCLPFFTPTSTGNHWKEL